MSSETWDQQPPEIPVRGDKVLFVDESNSQNTRLTSLGIEQFSRIQSAAKLYVNGNLYQIDDIVEFNNTIFRNTTAVTVAEDFDPVKWTEINGASSVVHVRNTLDLPDKLTASFSGFTDQGGMVARFTATSHGYTQNQTVQIATDTPSAVDGFHVIDVIDANTFEITLTVAVPSTDTGTATRCLADNTVYQLEIPYTTAFGFKQVDGAPSPITGQNTIRSSNTLINTLTLTADVLLFDADTFGSLILEDLSIIVTDPFTPFGTLFALDGIDIANNPFLQITNSQVNGIQNLGSLKNLFFVNDLASLFLYEIGLSLENVPTQSSGLSQGAFPGFSVVFSTIKNLTALPATSIFSGIQNFFQNSGPSVFDIDPATLTENRVTILDSGPSTPGNYFKVGTEETGAITAFATTTAATDPITGASGSVGVSPTTIETADTTGIETGDTVTITGTTSYNGTFVISNLIVDTSFEIDLDFVASETGTWTKVATLVTSNGHNLATGNTVEIEDTINYNQTFGVVVKDVNTFTIGRAFTNDDAIGNFTEIRVITAFADLGGGEVTVTSLAHGKSAGESVLIDETINYDGGFVIGSTTTDTFVVAAPFVVTETGVWRDGSLTQQDLAVVLRDVQNEINSDTRGSYFVNSNTVDTPVVDGTYVDFALGTTGTPVAGAIEGSDNQKWRITDRITAEIQYRGIEPFSGSLVASMTLQKPGGGAAQDYTFRGVKNGGLMVDQRETPLELENLIVSFAFSIPITAETDDKIRLQVQGVGTSANIDVQSISVIIM